MRGRSVGARVVALAGGAALVATTIVAVSPAASGAPKIRPASATVQYGSWSQPGAGFKANNDDTTSQVYQLTWRGAYPDLDDTPGPIYAAGSFIKSGSTTINRVAMYDSGASSWVTLPGDDTGIAPTIGMGGVSNGAPTPSVYGMALGGDDSLYVGGEFTASDDTLNNVAHWNGSDWVRMGNGLRLDTQGRVVQDMVVGNDFIGGDDVNYADDTVYALGGFQGTCATLACTATGTGAVGVAQYSQADDDWYPVGNGAMTGNYVAGGSYPQAYAGAYIDDTLYIAGTFYSVGGVSARNIAQWSAAAGAWLPLGAGIQDASQWDGVFSMAVHPVTKDLYVGGQFGQPVGGTTAMGSIVKWDYEDDTWYAVGTGLTAGNVDDISFSEDGKTMWIGNWANAPTIGGTFGNGLAKLYSEDFDDTTATTVSGSWDYLQASGVIGVTQSAASGGLNQNSTRAVLALNTGDAAYGKDVMAGGNFSSASVNLGRVGIFSPGAAPDPYAPVYPPGPATDVVATSKWKTVQVNWKAPSYTGSYPITNYRVTANPGGQVCITRLTDPDLTECTFKSLTPGVQYTFSVQGLNGGGWGERSAASNAATPQDIRITNDRRKKNNFFLGGGSTVTASGIAPGFAAGTKMTPWIMWDNSGKWEPGTNSNMKVRQDGTFSWKRKFTRKQNSRVLSIKFTIGDNESNSATFGRVR